MGASLHGSASKAERRPKLPLPRSYFKGGRSNVFRFFHSTSAVTLIPSLFSPFSWTAVLVELA
ncbi:hypothetical protein AN963_26910 [Brevibacillus choshinensis]|uniref:Uncharacterized protein n=1 Tax=Brevibacillus choshinensis TaxID=54911 RepID=A0ABR5N3E0_BRECH|nr:hypothetical protein AN963_26910 [Brevibacillus choshinensis]